MMGIAAHPGVSTSITMTFHSFGRSVRFGLGSSTWLLILPYLLPQPFQSVAAGYVRYELEEDRDLEPLIVLLVLLVLVDSSESAQEERRPHRPVAGGFESGRDVPLQTCQSRELILAPRMIERSFEGAAAKASVRILAIQPSLN